MAALLALLGSLAWGVADFLGGTASRRLDPLLVVMWAEAVGLVLVLPVAAGTGAFGAATGYLGWALVGGVAGAVALVLFFTALARGTMGVVAPIAAVGVIVPIVVGLVEGDTPSGLQLAGIAVAAVGVILASGPDLRAARAGGAQHLLPVLLALASASGFGVSLVCTAKAARHDLLMTLVVMRGVGAVLIAVLLLALHRSLRLHRSGLPLVSASGAADAGANLLYGGAATLGMLSTVAVLSSMYPAVTALLARAFHGERLSRVQAGGVVVVLAGVALIAGG